MTGPPELICLKWVGRTTAPFSPIYLMQTSKRARLCLRLNGNGQGANQGFRSTFTGTTGRDPQMVRHGDDLCPRRTRWTYMHPEWGFRSPLPDGRGPSCP